MATKKNVEKQAADVNTAHHRLLQAQLDCIQALVQRGMTARAAIVFVLIACEEAEKEVSS